MAHAALQTIRQHFHPLYQVRKLSWGRRLVDLVDVPVWLRMSGIGFKVRGRLISHGLPHYINGWMEPGPSALALVIARTFEIRSFWDIGANIGFYSWLLKTEQSELEIVLYEPLPANATMIRQTLERNRLSRVTIVPAAVSDSVGRSVLFTENTGISGTLEADRSSYEALNWNDSSFEVPTLTLDSEQAHRMPPDFLKIDVEGHEASTLLGAREILETTQPFVLIECIHGGHCLGALTKSGYKIVNADRLREDDWQGATNFLALPARYAERAREILRMAEPLARKRGLG
jgi:FkbM family methyltransferase